MRQSRDRPTGRRPTPAPAGEPGSDRRPPTPGAGRAPDRIRREPTTSEPSDDKGADHAAGTNGRSRLLGRALPRARRGHGPDRPGPHRRPRRHAGRARTWAGSRSWPSPASTASSPSGTRRHSSRATSRAAEEDVIEFLLHGEGNPSSILAAITAARENLRTARPVVPREAWEACNNLWLACTDNLAEADTREGRVLWLRRVIAGCQRINGILLGTMSRDEAMSFLLHRPEHRTGRPDHPGARRAVGEPAPQARR